MIYNKEINGVKFSLVCESWCTGWQFVGYNIMAAVVAILLCIKY